MKMTEMEKYFLEDETEDEYLERVRNDYNAVVPGDATWCPVTEEWIYRWECPPQGVWFDGTHWHATDEYGTEYDWDVEQEALAMGGYDERWDMYYDFEESHSWYSESWIDDGEDEEVS